MKYNYIFSLTVFLILGSSLSAERIQLQDGRGVLTLDSVEDLTFAYQSREGDIIIKGIDHQEVRIEMDQSTDDGLPSFIDWDKNRRVVTPKLLGEASRMNMTIFLPANSNVRLKCVDNSVSVSGLRGSIEISSVNGNVDIQDASGSILVANIDGDISLTVRNPGSREPISLTTVDGDITMRIPDVFDGDFELATLDGDITFNVPGSITVNKSATSDSGWILSRMQKQTFTVNKGNRKVLLNTVDGGIHILSR